MVTAAEQRVEMNRIAIESNPPSAHLWRKGPGPTYTVDTIEQLSGEVGCAGLFLLLGDSVAACHHGKLPIVFRRWPGLWRFTGPASLNPTL
jgi:nicotinic acid mononucleotide adenylyltransferase